MNTKMLLSDADRVRQAREKLDLTQAEFADLLGTSRRSLIKYEQGSAAVPRSLLMLIEYKLKERKR